MRRVRDKLRKTRENEKKPARRQVDYEALEKSGAFYDKIN